MADAQTSEPPLWLQIAEGEMGVSEVPGDKDNPRILEYLKAVQLPIHELHDEISWCSAFVGWCLLLAGIRGTTSPAARSWLNWGSELKKPLFGCVAVLKRGTGWQGHVGFYVGGDGNHIKLLGGNQSNKVCIDNFPHGSLLGFRWPK